MVTQIVYSKEFHNHDNSGHPENAKRLNVMLESLKNSEIYDKIKLVKPQILPEKILYDVHSESMIDQIKRISATEDSWIDLDTYVCINDFQTARLAAGGLLDACKDILNDKIDNAFSLARPPGHHATKKRSMGFCLFNNGAIAANELTKLGKKVLIFDPDVHHGNGTQDIFYDRNDVMYQSFHLSPHFPGTGDISEIGEKRGKGFNINAPLSHGTGDYCADKILDEIFLPIANQFKPDLIIVSSGFDSHHSDPLGGLKLTSNMFGKMISKYMKIQPKIACTLEGGYNLNWIGKCLISQLSVMAKRPIFFEDKTQEEKNIMPVLKEIRKKLCNYWDI